MEESLMPLRLSRRRFVQAGAAIGLGAGFLRADDAKPAAAEDRLQVGVIGVAGQGEYNWTNVVQAGATVVAICDVDENRAGKIRSQFPQAAFHTDFRRLLDQKGLDAVIVSTPDHTHAPATAAALKAGLHVYCEKPLTHTVHEARVIAELAKKHRRVTQMGTQIHAEDNYRRVVELIQGGAIGPVGEVHVWVGGTRSGGERPKDTPPVPAGLHWDLWLGPAPERPYHPAYVPFNWRGWWDFGGGTLADLACHHMDLPFWALKLRAPTTVAAEGAPVHPEAAAKWTTVRYEFPARGTLPPVKLTWYDGGKRPPHFADQQLPKWGDGCLFVGAKGMLIAGYGDHRLLPEEQFKDYARPKPYIPKSRGHHREWVAACRNGGTTTCNFDYSGALTEAVQLGVVAYRLGRPLTWDAKNLRAVNEPAADRFLRKEYRKPWTL
jgi:predicted dehydrogenase